MSTVTKTLCIDPGEDTGWSFFAGPTPVCGGTTKMYNFEQDLWDALDSDTGPLSSGSEHVGGAIPEGRIGRIICEDWATYPKEAHAGALDWDKMRTPRLIGAITFMARLKGIDIHFQPALIKERAKAGGAEEFFFRPLRENRHTNDSIMHGIFFWQTKVMSGEAPA